MNAYNENSYTDLVYRFMDGETSSVEQNVLFNALAKDSELQFEFQQAVSILKGFNADKVVLTPPAKLTNSLFVSAGFNPPMPMAAAATAGFVSKFKHLTTPLLSAAVGAFVTAFVFFAVNTGNNDNIQNNLASSSVTKTNEIAEVPASVIPVVKTSESKNITEMKTNIVADENQNVVVHEPYSRIFSSAETMYNISPDVRFNQPNNDYAVLYQNEDVGTFSLPEFNIMNLELEVRGMTGLAFLPSRTIEPEPFSIMNNIGAAIKYKFNKNHSAGIVAGKESLQMYSFKQTGDNYNFRHEPSLAWVGACYRYTGDEFYGMVSPYCEVTSAYSKFGPIGKAAIGIAYNPENIISMSLGLEGTALAYKFLGDLKSTEKISLVYNIGIHF
ncbi:MAG: hypothetical protein V1779_02470 [bacterium]